MPWQLIYTSAPRGLLSGQIGFCTVARSGDLREALIQRLEQISSYHYLNVAEAATANRNPTVSCFRILDLRGTKYYVLTRIQPCGLDFTARTNHLAHHLIFQSNELAQLPSPAAILRHWNGWLSSWQGEPRILEDPPVAGFSAAAKQFLPAQAWLRITGDSGRAAGLLESECVRGCYLVCPPGSEQQVLDMYCETLQLLNLNGQFGLRPWRHPFTSFLQGEDNAADFQWRACQEGTPAHQQALQRTAPLIPLRSVRVPTNSLVKAARAGNKPPAPAPAASTKTTLTLQRQPASAVPVSAPVVEFSDLPPPKARSGKPPLLDVNFSIKWATMASLGVFAAVLLGLMAARHWMSKKPVPIATSVQPVEAVPESPSPVARMAEQPNPKPIASAETARVDSLAGDGPTYVFTTANLASFNLSVDSISRFQNFIHRFDHLEIRPDDLRLSVNTDQWDGSSATPLIVSTRQGYSLIAHDNAGVEYAFDYSNWINDNNNNPLAVRINFANAPRAFSIHFGFSSPDKGEPFRLLIVNESNCPPPLQMGLQWLRDGCDSVTASLLVPLGPTLSANFILPRGRRWQLQPFVPAQGARKTDYLYQNWTLEELPPPGSELDFALVQQRLASLSAPLKAKSESVNEKLDKQLKLTDFNFAVGTDLGLTNTSLASLSAFAPDPTLSDFINYLNKIKKQSGIKTWPHVSEDDDEDDLAARFQQLYDYCIQKFPGQETAKLMVGETNYFYAAWHNLKSIDKIRLEKKRLTDEIEALQQRRRAVPDTLDKVAYVGLFMIDPPRPGLEMIRFQAP